MPVGGEDRTRDGDLSFHVKSHPCRANMFCQPVGDKAAFCIKNTPLSALEGYQLNIWAGGSAQTLTYMTKIVENDGKIITSCL